MIAMWLIAAHMAGDYLFQSAYMAANKLHDDVVRLAHVTVYTACFVPIAIHYADRPAMALFFLFFLFVTHFLTDSNRWRTSNPWPAMPILQDQSLHAVQIAILGGIFLT